ncbi:MAG: alpha/beta hydrolase [Chitinophagaceae bacterium]
MTESFPYNGIDISYRNIGKGRPVMLLHGFGEDSHIFDKQIAELKEHCRLIVPDLPGSGNSVIPTPLFLQEQHPASSIDKMAVVMAGLIQSITSEPVIVLGHSMGGYITLAIAEKFPELVYAFGLLHSSAFADSEEKKEGRRKSIGFINEHGTFAFLQTAIPGLFAEGFQKEHATEVSKLVESGRAFTKEALIGYYEAMIERPDRTHILTGSKRPVLFVLGLADNAIPPGDVLKQVNLPDVSYFHALEDVAHMGMWEATGEMNSIIIKFITAIE